MQIELSSGVHHGSLTLKSKTTCVCYLSEGHSTYSFVSYWNTAAPLSVQPMPEPVEVKNIIVCLVIAMCVPLVLMSSCPLFHDKVTLPPNRSHGARAMRDRLE